MTKLPNKQLRSLKQQGTTFLSKQKPKKLKYQFVNRWWYNLRDYLVAQLDKINFDKWKRPFIMKLIDIIFNSAMVGFIIVCWRTKNPWLIGISVTLFFIVFRTYVEEYLRLFRGK